MSASGVYAPPRPPSIAWPEPMESVYQRLPCHGGGVAGARRPDVDWPQRLFMSAVVAIPREQRYGAVSWIADVLGVSRQMVCDVAARVHGQVGAGDRRDSGAGNLSAPACEPRDYRLQRAALTLLFPGGVTLRPMGDCLEELLGCSRPVGWLSEFVNEAGRRAGQILDAADWTAVSPFVAARDEKLFDDRAYLLTVDPKSLAIVSGHVEDSVDGDCWAVSLALDQDKTGHRLIGLAEDGATWYPGSTSGAAALTGTPYLMPVQKDHFHVLRRAGQTLRHLETAALRRLDTAEQKATTVSPGLTLIRDFDGWEKARREADEAVARAQDLHFWTSCLADALELVEPRSGAIRDEETSTWYLDEILKGMSDIDGHSARSLVTYIANQKHQLFTFLGWLQPSLDTWRHEAGAHFGDQRLVEPFERAIARAWRNGRAKQSGSRRTQRAARARDEAESMCQNDPVARRLAFTLTSLLDEAVRGSSAAETINSILERYLHPRRSFQNRHSAQNYLNLFVLWHGLRRFRRGKRRGRSPFEAAGIRILDRDSQETDDWRTALGYPPKNS